MSEASTGQAFSGSAQWQNPVFLTVQFSLKSCGRVDRAFSQDSAEELQSYHKQIIKKADKEKISIL